MAKNFIKTTIQKLGFDLVRYQKNQRAIFPPDFEKQHIDIINRVRPYSITSNERIYALIESVNYIIKNNIEGEFIECGVYQGGSMMAIALSLLSNGVNNRDLYLFDTFEGMPKPGQKDLDINGLPAVEYFNKTKISESSSTWMNASIQSVKDALFSIDYPKERIHFVKGLVEDTIPVSCPELLALARLDTDWYTSTMHEMKHLYPRLSSGGVLIIDDYGHFKGAKEAVDEYFSQNNILPLLNRLDYTGRLIIKQE